MLYSRFGIFNDVAHKTLWNWLYLNPGKEKNEWPGFVNSYPKFSSVRNYCFACSAVAGNCEKCPIDWKDCGDMHTEWEDAPNSKIRKEIAAAIRDMPIKTNWHPYTPKIPKIYEIGVFYHQGHQDMWGWIANTHSDDKTKWPGWEINGGPWKKMELATCFACAACEECVKCPLDWETPNRKSNRCIPDYELWEAAKDPEKRSILANTILNLPIKKDWEGIVVEREE